jgi:AcrR family transcriptional regulator
MSSPWAGTVRLGGTGLEQSFDIDWCFILERCSLSNGVLSLDRCISQSAFDDWYAVPVSIPTPPWQRVPDRAAGRRREPISRAAIVDAAVALLDRDGYEALSMRALAQELGTGAASLYWHVGSRDGLLDLVMDQVIGELAVPAADPARWQEQVREFGRGQRAAVLRHPYIVRVSLGRIPMGPNAIRVSEGVVAIMRAGGLPPRLAVQGYLLLLSAVNGFTSDETNGGEQPAGPDEPSAQEIADMVAGYFAALPAGSYPHLRELAGEFSLADDDERFELLLDIFVDGLARRARAAGQ